MELEVINPTPSDFFRLIGNKIRWQILLELSHSDLKVQEIVDSIKQPQNLVSYHLQLLLEHGLVTISRSNADGREIYYGIEVNNLRNYFRSSAAALHPSLLAEDLSKISLPMQEKEQPLRVLFLCTHNSARSQMAEGILRSLGNENIQVFSAGAEPSSVHPLAIKALKAMGIDISNQVSKNLDQFIEDHFDFVITVCDKAREICPIFPGNPNQIHWSFPDPTEIKGTEEDKLAAFQRTAQQLKTRISFLLIGIDWSKKPGVDL